MAELVPGNQTVMPVEGLIEIGDYDRWWECVGSSDEHVLGVSVVGMAQAGKSTLCGIIDQYITRRYGVPGGNFMFSVSNGFRGITTEVLRANNLPLHQPIANKELYRDQVEQFIATHGADLSAVMLEAFMQPEPTDVLRSVGVTSAVAATSEHPTILSTAHTVGGQYLKEVLQNPETVGLLDRPGAVLMDARSQPECVEKFEMAGVLPALGIVLECPEYVVAQRIVMNKVRRGNIAAADAPAMIAAEEARLQERNRIDRARPIGTMTLGEDLDKPYYLHDLIAQDKAQGHDQRVIAEAGLELAGATNSGLVIDTSKISLRGEKYGMDLILAGILEGVDQLTRR